jgi:hypothetical protein
MSTATDQGYTSRASTNPSLLEASSSCSVVHPCGPCGTRGVVVGGLVPAWKYMRVRASLKSLLAPLG